MAVVLYKCDTCEREIELQRQPDTIETFGRCVITEGCRGHLYQLDIKQDYVRPKRTKPVEGLTDWIQRRKLYTHYQTVNSSQWVVDHNLGVLPSVQVVVEREISGQQTQSIEVEPERIETVDLNRIIIHLPRAESGVAQCIARSTVQPGEREVEQQQVQTEPVQLSNDNTISIATRSEIDNIYLKMHFTDEGNVFNTYVYKVDTSPSFFSPWSNLKHIYVNNKRYLVRSFNFKNPYIDTDDFINGTITQGSAIYVSEISFDDGVTYQSLERDQVLFLLAQEPFNVQDKLLNQLVFPVDIIAENASNSMYIDNDEIYVTDQVINNIFPHIKAIG